MAKAKEKKPSAGNHDGDASTGSKGKADKKTPIDADALKDEVAAFAAQLGLGKGHNLGFSALTADADDAFSDFAPEKSKQPISNETSKAKKATKEQRASQPSTELKAVDNRKDASKPATNGTDLRGKQQGHQQPAKQRQQDDDQHGQPVAEPAGKRQWNFGAGPRPGEQHGRSLLGKDKPAVWHEAAAALPALPPTTQQLAIEEVDELRRQAEQLVANEVAAAEKELQRRNPADYRWLQQVKKSGTTADKVAAITLQIQESVVTGFQGLDTLLSWVSRSKGGRDLVRQAIEALQELFLTVLLPDRRLKTLEQQPLAALPQDKEGAKYLLWWYVEDQIKVRYTLFITALEECSKDNLEFVKEKSIKAMYDLLVKKPEGEAKLLAGLCNKLGDPSRKLASKTSYLLTQLLLAHPLMKPVVVREVERFIFRPGLQDRARYYAVVFLNQIPLSHKEAQGGSALAHKLIDVYFTLFRLLVEGKIGLAAETRKQQEERYRKEKAAYLRAKQKRESTSVNGAKGSSHAAAVGMKNKTREPPVKRPKKPTLAMPEEMDARLLSALITGIRRALPYVDAQEVEPVLDQHSQQLYRLVHTAPFPVAVQALMLMWQTLAAKETATDRFYRALYSSLAHQALPLSTKAPMFLALLYKAMKSDVSSKRGAAFAKRLLQCASVAPAAFACAALLLLSETLKAQPSLWTGILQPEEVGGIISDVKRRAAGSDDEDDGLETFKDVDDDEEGNTQVAGKDSNAETKAANGNKGVASTTAGHHHNHTRDTDRSWPRPGYYDLSKREPTFALGETACWWELNALVSHTHPSVAAFARTLLAGQHIIYNGDPLKDHGLVAFLDKYIAKRPKANLKGASLMQPVAATTTPTNKPAAGVGSDAFTALAESQVQPDEVFFHRFYTSQTVKARREALKAAKQAKKQKGDAGSEEGSESEDAVSGDELEDQEVDEFLEKQEGGVDDGLGDPDIGYDYEGLVAAMQDDPELRGNGDGDGDDGEAEEGSQDGNEEEEPSSKKTAKDSKDKGKTRTFEDLSAAADVSDLEDSGDDEEGEFVMADEQQLQTQISKATKGKNKKQKQAGDIDMDDPDEEEIAKLDVGILDLPSPSESESESSGEDEGTGSQDAENSRNRKKRKLDAKTSAHSFDFSDSENDNDQQDSDDDDEGEGHEDEENGIDSDDDNVDEIDEDDLEGLLGEGDEEEEDMAVPSDDDNDIDMGSDSADDELQETEDTRSKDASSKKAGGAPKRSRSMFASADNYADMLDELYNKAKAASGNGASQKEDQSKQHSQKSKAEGRKRGRGGGRR